MKNYFELQKSMKSYENYKKLRTSYEIVTKSYKKLQKVTNELPGAIWKSYFAKSWKNSLPITILNGMVKKIAKSTRADVRCR